MNIRTVELGVLRTYLDGLEDNLDNLDEVVRLYGNNWEELERYVKDKSYEELEKEGAEVVKKENLLSIKEVKLRKNLGVYLDVPEELKYQEPIIEEKSGEKSILDIFSFRYLTKGCFYDILDSVDGDELGAEFGLELD